MVLTKTSYYYDLKLLKDCLRKYKPTFNKINQLSIKYDPEATADGTEPHYSCLGNTPERSKQWKYTELSPIFKGSEFEKLLTMITEDTRRVRLMAMAPRSCLSLHKDTYKRLHWAIETYPECHMSFQHNPGDEFFGFHIPADGYGYMVDTRIPHTAINPTLYVRYHLVIDVVE